MSSVVIRGIAGKMGQYAAQAVIDSEKHNLVAGIDKNRVGNYISDLPEIIEGPNIKIVSNIEKALSIKTQIDVMVDFTCSIGLIKAVETAVKNNIDIIIGTTGLSSIQLDELNTIAKMTGRKILVVPNFSLGAVLMMKLSKLASHYFSKVEIIEEHNEGKKDAPSGTSLAIAKMIKTSKTNCLDEKIKFLANNVREDELENIRIHSVRLPGIISNHKVKFGGESQTLSLKHEVISLSACKPGIILAIDNIEEISGFVYGLSNLL